MHVWNGSRRDTLQWLHVRSIGTESAAQQCSAQWVCTSGRPSFRLGSARGGRGPGEGGGSAEGDPASRAGGGAGSRAGGRAAGSSALGQGRRPGANSGSDGGAPRTQDQPAAAGTAQEIALRASAALYDTTGKCSLISFYFLHTHKYVEQTTCVSNLQRIPKILLGLSYSCKKRGSILLLRFSR